MKMNQEQSISLMRCFRDEEVKQQRFFKRLITEGYTLMPNSDPYNLLGKLGKTVTLTVYCDDWTPNYLCKLNLVTSEGKQEIFHLIPLWQILRFQQAIPNPGETYQGNFIIGVKKDVISQTFVPALRLPRR